MIIIYILWYYLFLDNYDFKILFGTNIYVQLIDEPLP